jgi:hypothetical protein
MVSRYKQAPASPPSLADLQLYLRDAQPTLRERIEEGEACEKRRVSAHRALLTIARAQVAEADNIEPPPPEPRSRLRAMPTELRWFLEIAGLRILLSDDPVGATRRFLGLQRARGRPLEDNERRDILVAADVLERRNGLESVSDACNAVAEQANMSPEMVRKIYFARRTTLEVKAELGWRSFRKLESGGE